MQQTKRRSKGSLTLLALAIALLVVAIVPAAAMASTANGVLEPSLDFSGYGADGQGGHFWFGDGTDPVQGEYTPYYNGAPTTWTGIAIEPVYGGGVIDVLKINWIIAGDNPGHSFQYVHPGGPPQLVSFGPAYNHAPDGLYTIDSWLTETTATAKPLVRKPIVTDTFGIDNTVPEWQHVTIGDCYYNVPVKFSAIAADPYGSGVAPTPTASWTDNVDGAKVVDGVPLAWDKWIYEVTGTVNPPAHPFWGTTWVYFEAYDMVGNYGYQNVPVMFDLVAPTTSYKIDPAGADNQNGWTNKPVTVTFTAADSGGAGVDYTEYIVKTSTTTAPPATPGINEAGTKGTSVVINETAPIGPNYVYYRSVDKACPTGNKEAWKLVMVFFDDVAPALSDDTPDWWINNSLLDGFSMWGSITITGSDHNSGLAVPGIKWTLAGHPGIGGSGMGPNVMVPILALGIADGIRDLQYTATDKAGNTATGGNQVKIDTRAPVTDGAADWVNGLKPYVLTATDQVPGAGVAATVYRVDQATPWKINEAATVAPTLTTEITLSGSQGAMHTIDFASVDAALPFYFDPDTYLSPSWHYGNWELDVLNLLKTGAVYKSRTVKMDITAPEVSVTGNDDAWHKVPVTLNFAATDVGAGVDYIESSTDGGATWTKGDTATISDNGEITVSFRAVDKVGIVSATETTVVKVSTTRPTVTGGDVTVKKGKKATFSFNVTAVTPTANNVVIEIRTKSGRTVSSHRFNNVPTNSDQTRAFKINLKKGKYNIRIGATDAAGNVQSKRGTGTLTVK